MLPPAVVVRWFSDPLSAGRRLERNRKFVDSPLERAGFEPFVPLRISASPSWWSPARKPHGARGEFLRGGTNSSSPVVLAMRPWEEICAVEVEKIEQEEHHRDGVAAVRRQLDQAVGGDAVGAHGLGWHFDLALEPARATRWPTGRTRLSQ